MTADGFVEERRGRARLALRADLARRLLAAGIERPAALVRREAIRTYRGRAHAALLAVSAAGGEPVRIVVREYRHGGALGRLLGGLFLFGDRAQAERRALGVALGAGIDVARPVATVRRAWGPLYRAHLATEEVAGAEDMVSWLVARGEGRPSPDPRVVLEAVGRALRRLHDAGVDVPDLHLKNVLIRSGAPERPVLIDFDRAGVRPSPVTAARRRRDLFRLDRSVEKLRRSGTPVARCERARLFRGYLAGDRIPRAERRSACWRYRLHLALHRLAWRLRGRSR